MCGAPAVDAHHIVERKLWPDQGFYLENGASVCADCHLQAEATTISCDELRSRAGILRFPLPPHFNANEIIDKWGNPILPNGMRLRGELFDDESVQKILAPVLHLFTDKVKYPRTWHLPWSPGATKDDCVHKDLSPFEKLSCEIVATEKMDGENTTLARDYLHARSTEYHQHESRDWVKALHGRIAHEIPKGWRICGENLYAKHSIKYENLSSYFQVFSIWNEKNSALSWDETTEWVQLLELQLVPVIYRGPWNEKKLHELHLDGKTENLSEGYVVRPADGFHLREFRRVVGKYVRANHVQTGSHWIRGPVVPNGLVSR